MTMNREELTELVNDLDKLHDLMRAISSRMTQADGEMLVHGRELDGASLKILSWIKAIEAILDGVQ